MIQKLIIFSILFLALACAQKPEKPEISPIVGSWKLLTGILSSPKDTTITNYTQGQEMIKIITPTHFAFMRHDLSHGKDSTAQYSAGGGRVNIEGNKYTEYLDYFNLREWEDHKFEFTFEIKGDTLITKGIEKLEKLGIEQMNEETYLRIKN